MPRNALDTTPSARVLVVDDEPMLADLIQEYVKEKWGCVTVNSGRDALEVVDDGFDVVTLDRRMPDVSGDEVLQAIRDRDIETKVLMVSAIDPDFEIIDMPFDGYLSKPVSRSQIQEAIEGLLLQRTYHPTVEQFLGCARKIELLEDVKSSNVLAGDDRYLELRATADELRQSSPATLAQPTAHVERMHDIEADD